MRFVDIIQGDYRVSDADGMFNCTVCWQRVEREERKYWLETALASSTNDVFQIPHVIDLLTDFLNDGFWSTQSRRLDEQ